MATYKNLRKVLNLPTLSENPSSGVNGEMYFNTTDSALYIYDGEWKKVTQSAVPSWKQAGETYCYTYGSNASDHSQKTQKITIATDAIAESGSNTLSQTRYSPFTGKSETVGYIISGASDYMDKHTFASDAYAAVNNATEYDKRGASAMNDTNCYQFGGSDVNSNTIKKVTYSSEAQSAYGGTISDHSNNKYACGISSDTHGIIAGRFVSSSSPTRTRNIHKFSFASEGNTTSLGTMSTSSGQQLAAGSRSNDGRGFSAGGYDAITANAATANIEQITFASGASANFGNTLTTADQAMATPFTASVSYVCAGNTTNTTFDKFSHSSGTNTVDIGTNFTGDKYPANAGLGS